MQFKWIFAPKECFSTLIIRQNDFAKSDLRMNARSYQELLNSKQRIISFLIMNAASSVFTLLLPLGIRPHLPYLYYVYRYFVW